MMRNDYLDAIIRRGNELNMLEQAAALYDPKSVSFIRWAVAGVFGLLVALLPSVCTAQAFIQII